MLLQRHAVLPFYSSGALPHLSCPSTPQLPYHSSAALPHHSCPSTPQLPFNSLAALPHPSCPSAPQPSHQVCNLHVAAATKALSVLAGSETMSKRLREGEAEAVLSSIQDSSSGPLCSLQVCFAMQLRCALCCTAHTTAMAEMFQISTAVA